ncbi:MAG TPA: FAD-dependent monooxygenase [Chitinophagaceae bacterium]|jgi:flavin-dependent dehydrogenase|nr:FAD-dependent monooxygenase [Chitinophagaceae bacterium]
MNESFENSELQSSPFRGRGGYDVAIAGGGLAGLALSIQCAHAGYRTILFEKEKYPFHKVCGEYISVESWNFLEELGVPLSQMNLPIIRRLLVTAPNGKELRQNLPLGGFGISRYKLDAMLAEIAKQNGVELIEGTKVEDIKFEDEIFTMQAASGNCQAKIATGAFGKRTNFDVKWKRKFVLQKHNKLNNYIGVKYHVKTNWPEDLIALHNFDHGYCGISKIEGNKYCLCYLTTAKNLELCGNSIPQMEKQVLCRNRHLKLIFENTETISQSPVTISQISFEKKEQVYNHVLLLGDAAGMIAPLCGNGMSMALHGSKIAFEQIHLFLQNKIPRWQMEQQYVNTWKGQFSGRLRTGRMVQRFFGSVLLSDLLISVLKPFPSITDKLIRETHGQPF